MHDLLEDASSEERKKYPVYTGFDLTVHQNRPVWNTPLMPVLFVAMSVVSGAAVASSSRAPSNLTGA